ncbi:echinoderm microtubule-associated protein-like 2 isoform X10 [Octopus vulgaris]|uniref:Echinoderm microtubule-associated protein-like 2 isoform X10 n=1 Tax=Octopus vulgaris TaxID=6645 RepID=A0AA36B8W4_OCTVU|nr:echinoderm microtubule-associated protein-like 2 isoform X10 [Octopus vulgaris]
MEESFSASDAATGEEVEMDLPRNEVLTDAEVGCSDLPVVNATSPDVGIYIARPSSLLRSLDDITDGLLDQDQETLSERVAILEKKVQLQGDEIVCLKSALADVIRKLNQVQESGKVLQNNILPSKPAFKSASRRGEKKAVHLSPVESIHSAPHRSTTPPARTSPSHKANNANLKKWSSLSTTTELNDGNVKPFSSKEPFWNLDEGYLKIYLRGRPINLYAPSNVTDFSTTKTVEPPSEKLQLEWVYGYRGRDCRSNLHYLPTGEIVYFIAATVVLYNVEEEMQRHYLGHTDDVKCLTVHPDKIRIATGQVAGHDRREGRAQNLAALKIQRKRMPLSQTLPHIRIWESVRLTTLMVIGIGDFERAVCCLSFSKLDGGQHLVAVDEANEHVISVWDISKEKAHKVTETKSSTETVLSAEFHPSEKNTIVTCGKSHISFWTLESGALTKKMGIFDKHEKPKYILCLAFADNGDVLSGDSNGNIFVWCKGGNRISQAILGAHEGGVFSLCVLKNGLLLSGGGKDRRIVEWDGNSYKQTGNLTEIPEQFGPVRTLSQGKGNLILVGTTRNCILQGTVYLKFNPIVQGHTDELWALYPHPTQNQFLTCGYDKHVYLWDSLSHTVVWSKEVNESAHCCCFHPDGHLVVIGTQTGRWLVLDLTTREIITTHCDGSEQIECVRFSPDGNFLAVGSRDNSIYIHHVSESGSKYSRIGKCTGHSSFITHIDWSVNSQYIQSNSGDYEVLFWTASTCKQLISPNAIRELEWQTSTCTLTFNLAGIWPEGADGTDINASCRSNSVKQLAATADDFGKVNLYKYPCSQPSAKSHTYGGHSSHVTNVAFLHDDSRLISVGGKDMAILEWSVI